MMTDLKQECEYKMYLNLKQEHGKTMTEQAKEKII